MKNEITSDPRIIPIGGGKGGIGKSVVSAAVGSILAQKGEKVVFIDADFGGANLHHFLGIKYPAIGLNDFLNDKTIKFEDVLLDTDIPGTKLISGASDILGLANPKFSQKQKIIRAIKNIDADYIIIDLGAGTNFNTIDFYTLSNNGIVIINTELTTMENAYGFLKTSILRKFQRINSKDTNNSNKFSKSKSIGALLNELDKKGQGEEPRKWLASFRPRLILNRVKKKEDINIAKRFCDITKKYLNIELIYIGYITEDAIVQNGAKNSIALVNEESKGYAHMCINTIVSNIIQLDKQTVY